MEDDRVARATGRVKTTRAVMCHNYRDAQSEVGIRTDLGNRVAESRLSYSQTRGTSSKVGAKKCFEFQNVLGIRGRKGKPKNSFLRDSAKEKFGPRHVGAAAQDSGQTQGVFAGPCYANPGEQTARPIGRHSLTNLRAECKGRSEEKIDMAIPSCDGHQEREVSAVEEKGSQETISIQVQGCSEDNNKKKTLSREERCVLKDTEGNKAGDEVRYYCAPEKESSSGKFPEKTPFGADLEYAGGRCGFQPAVVDSSGNDLRVFRQAGEKSNCSSRGSDLDLASLRVEDEGEDDTRVDRSVNSDGKGLGNTDGTRAESSGSERQYRLETQAVMLSGSGQFLKAGRGSGPGMDMGMELGRALVSSPSLGLDYRAALCPDSTKRARLNGLILYEPTCFKSQAEVLKTGLSQDLLSRPDETLDSLEPTSSYSEAGKEGNASFYGEADKLREVAVQEEGHNLKNRYNDNIFDQSNPIPFSVFGCPLLSGGFSGLGDSSPEKALVPLRVVAADGREWGLESPSTIIDEGEGIDVVGQRKKEAQCEQFENWNYGSWESSCLVKFSDFLGFPTKGFEKEILNLLRNLVASQ